MNYSAKEAKEAAMRVITDRKVTRMQKVGPQFANQMARLKEIAESGEWGAFFSVPHGQCQDFIWYFENQGFSVIVAPQIRQESRDHITYHVTWS